MIDIQKGVNSTQTDQKNHYTYPMKTLKIEKTLTPHQHELFGAITSQIENIIKVGMAWDNMVSLSGAAGTGKTYLTAAIIEYLQQKYRVTVTAPTHKALNVITQTLYKQNIIGVNTKTLHSFLNIKLFTDYTKGIQRYKPEENKAGFDRTDVLIVDESSMVSDELYGFLLDAVRNEQVKAVMFVGDYYQLLPIDSGKNSVFSVRHQYQLQEIVRQAKDSYIIKIATAARECIHTGSYVDLQTFFKTNMDTNISFFHNQVDFIASFTDAPKWNMQNKVIASFRNGDVDSYNQIVRDHYWKQKGMTGEIPALLRGDKIVFQSAYSIKGVLKYANNDEITLSSAKRVHSDKTGLTYWECFDEGKPGFQEVIRIIDPLSISSYNDRLNKMSQAAREEKDYAKRFATWKAFFEFKELYANVKYTYASTIHKLQGSTYETVYIDLYSLSRQKKMNFDQIYRLTYVALTRASKEINVLIPAWDGVDVERIENDFLEFFGSIDL